MAKVRRGNKPKAPKKGIARKKTNSSSLSLPARVIKFEDYQAVVDVTDEKKNRIVSLLGLVGEIGDLHSRIKKLMIQRANPTFRSELLEEFGDVLWYLTSLASLYKIPLLEIAQENSKKAQSLYSNGTVSKFDSKFPADEQLPKRFKVTFYQKPLDEKLYVKIVVNSIVIGDTLTDNAHTDDGYRFHDVFHFAYAAVLGWSPVTRSLLKCKRKSDPKIDEVEDGARALIIEEAISLLVFNNASERNWFQDPSTVDIGLLKTIRKMTSGLEVRSCTAKQWQSAILQGYAAFSSLVANSGGDIVVDLEKQTIAYKPLTRRRQSSARRIN